MYTIKFGEKSFSCTGCENLSSGVVRFRILSDTVADIVAAASASTATLWDGDKEVSDYSSYDKVVSAQVHHDIKVNGELKDVATIDMERSDASYKADVAKQISQLSSDLTDTQEGLAELYEMMTADATAETEAQA